MKVINPQELENNQLLEIGKHIRFLRKTKTNLSAENFAHENGFDRVQYSRIENGANITLKTLFKVLAVYKMSLKDFANSMD